jgi:CRISPR-associated exonuclease Cas4
MKSTNEITGVMFEYYFICKRKLWLFSNQIKMEDNNENVHVGKLIHDNTYKRNKKNILIDNTINIDYIKDKKEVHEVKKTKSIEEASIWQLKYYIYYLEKKGLCGLTGIIDYPLLKERKKIIISKEDIDKIDLILSNIVKIIDGKIPEVFRTKKCSKCSYYELCYI